MEKKRICLITNWYPTKANPYIGSFFKEQAFATSEHFDYLVLHYHEHKGLLLVQYFLRKIRGKTVAVLKTNEEKNTVEYDVHAYYPIYTVIFSAIYNIYMKKIRHAFRQGVGKYISPAYICSKRRKLETVFLKKLQEHFDVLYCVNAQKESNTLQLVSEITNVPYIVAEHAPFPWPGEVITDIEYTAIANADAFFAISNDKVRQIMMQNIKPKRIAYVGNMVDEKQFTLAPQKNDIKTFLIVAANSFYKNYDLFISVFNRLTEITDIPFRVMLVGYAANKGYSQNAEQLEEKIRHSKFAQYAEMIPEISHDRIHVLYARADAFVMTSVQEGQPVSALEAGCCGLPIFSTMCGGVEDYVTEDIGRLYQVMDYEGFARGLKDYLEGKITFDSSIIRETVVATYGKAAFIERFESTINSIVDYNQKLHM